ncbi:hypothetical protein EYC80_003066 [Monilinia laxa]|uniref:Uncharacterized protein n=1 Tax=Monilinia laxa TaxID=61186 RepID=A0A5N6KCK2_MONLA|nr:hypothetical protein EYC80_003066 [Monilinia laxa]
MHLTNQHLSKAPFQVTNNILTHSNLGSSSMTEYKTSYMNHEYNIWYLMIQFNSNFRKCNNLDNAEVRQTKPLNMIW